MAGEKAGERMNDLYALYMSRPDSPQGKKAESRNPAAENGKKVRLLGASRPYIGAHSLEPDTLPSSGKYV